MTYRDQTEFRAHDAPVLAADLAGGRLVTGGGDGAVQLLDLDGTTRGTMKEHRDIVKSVRFSPERDRVATGSKDGAVLVWDLATDTTREAGRHENWVMGVAWSPDGVRVASVSEDSSLRIWDAAGGGEIASFALDAPANAVDWSPDGSRIAVASGARRLHVFSAEAEHLRAIRGATQILWAARFSPDGAAIGFAGRDRAVRVVGVEGEEPSVLGLHAQQVWSLEWSAGGDRIVTAGADRAVRVWDAAGAQLATIRGDAWFRFAGWSGDRLVVADERGIVRVLEDDGEHADVEAAPAPPSFDACPHIDASFTETDVDRCRECGATESLRLCMTCGHVGCCESQLAHGTRHWEETGHPNTTPTPPGELPWRWCYECDDYVKREAGA